MEVGEGWKLEVGKMCYGCYQVQRENRFDKL